VNLIFTIDAPQVHHDIMIARFDKAAKDEVEAEELAGEGQSLWTARVNPKTQARVGRSVDLAIDTSAFHYFDRNTGMAVSGGPPAGTPTHPEPPPAGTPTHPEPPPEESVDVSNK
jgi:multiple sugar transport system ATP-binding protein